MTLISDLEIIAVITIKLMTHVVLSRYSPQMDVCYKFLVRIVLSTLHWCMLPIINKNCTWCLTLPNIPDLRDDSQFFVDHPGAVPISTAQVKILDTCIHHIVMLCYISNI